MIDEELFGKAQLLDEDGDVEYAGEKVRVDPAKWVNRTITESPGRQILAPDTESGYPGVDSGRPQDAAVLARLDAVIEALSDRDALADAFESGGIFAGAYSFEINDPHSRPRISRRSREGHTGSLQGCDRRTRSGPYAGPDLEQGTGPSRHFDRDDGLHPASASGTATTAGTRPTTPSRIPPPTSSRKAATTRLRNVRKTRYTRDSRSARWIRPTTQALPRPTSPATRR